MIEAVRLYPTVTTPHRISEKDEEVIVGFKKLLLTPGDEIVIRLPVSILDWQKENNAIM